MPLVLKIAYAVTICRIGLSQQLTVLHRDLGGRALAHLVLVEHGHADFNSILSDLESLLHFVENWLLARNGTSLGVVRSQVVQDVILFAFVLTGLLFGVHWIWLAPLLLVVVEQTLFADFLHRLIDPFERINVSAAVAHILQLIVHGLLVDVAISLSLPLLIVSLLLHKIRAISSEQTFRKRSDKNDSESDCRVHLPCSACWISTIALTFAASFYPYLFN